MISYAQNFEDVILERFFKDVIDGFYVDIGAADPTVNSVTKHFYDKGWNGINVEPSNDSFKKLIKERGRDINLNLVVSDINGAIDFFDLPNTGLSSIVESNAVIVKNNDKQRDYDGKKVENLNKIILESRTLESILNEFAEGKEINFLKIDVEGAEEAVIKSNKWDSFRPKVLLVEATEPNSQIANHEKWDMLLASAKYTFVYFDGLNRFYLRNDLMEYNSFFLTPPCVFDDYIKYSEVQLRENNHSLCHENAELQSQHSELQSHQIELLSQHSELQSQHSELQSQHVELQSQHFWLRSQHAELLSRLNSMENSYSWRFTFPFRIALKILKKMI